MSFMPLVFVAASNPSAFKTPRDAPVIAAAMLIFCFAISLHWKLWFYALE
jgi:hypothetical protein